MSATTVDLEALRARVAAIPDPEVPVLTIDDLGVLRSVEEHDGRVTVTITPTYSGCPAMHYIEQCIRDVLSEAGADGDVVTTFSPAWSTTWMSDAGREKLREYGIAPPRHSHQTETPISIVRTTVECPRCGSPNTELVSAFGSTACKALRRCLDCLEPFDHFKELT